MKFTNVLSTAILASYAVAKDVACLVNGEAVGVVDLDTGVCPFTIPQRYPVAFDFVSSDEYDVTFYYAVANSIKYFNQIADAGRTISIPASILYGLPATPCFQVHLDRTPPSNSTAAIRRRLLKQVEMVKRAEVDDFIATAETTDGTAIDGVTFEVVDLSSSSVTATGTGVGSTGIVTETDVATTVITITTCSNNACGEATVSATASEVVTTVNEEVTSYTTYCPLTTVITVTSCSDDACATSEVPVTPSLTTETVEGEVTSYYTYCPLTGETTTTEVETTVITITSCSEDKCSTSEVSATQGPVTTTVAGEETIYTTWCPVTGETTAETTTAAVSTGETVAAESTTLATSAAAATSTSPINTFEGAGNKVGSSLLAVALIPLAGLFI
ncbi:yeast-form wall protein 1 [Yamadazyma tenuis]|uniref:yeast-form wall protein 1 n=1 Tax=Candida tenuis TaxID=2315449 RepID=UPI0027A9EDD6|nr:yeast-form wall protein 1 [Yamadazyma tenuis]